MIKNIVGLVFIAVLTGSIEGCIFYPVSKKDVIGTYQAVLQDGTPGLPDGGSEILELREDGICEQKVALKDGRKFSAKGTWEWDNDPRYVGNQIIIMGIYNILDLEDKIGTDIEKTMGMLQSYPAGRNMISRIILGSREGVHYEKK